MAEETAVLEVEARLKDFMSANLATLTENIKKFSQQTQSSGDQVKSSTDKMAAGFEMLNKVMGAIGAVKAFEMFIDASEESSRAMARLQQAVSNSGADFSKYKKQVEEVTEALSRKTNFGDEDQIAALAKLVPMVGSMEKALNVLPNVLDLAAFKQTDLSNAVMMYGKALEGNFAPLGKTFTFLQNMKKEGASTEQMVAALSERLKGTAEVDISGLKQFEIQFHEIKKTVGDQLLPVMEGINEVLKVLPRGLEAVTVAGAAFGVMLMTLGGPITAAVIAIAGIAAVIGHLSNAYKDVDNWTQQYVDSVQSGAQAQEMAATGVKKLNDLIKERSRLLVLYKDQSQQSQDDATKSIDAEIVKYGQFVTKLKDVAQAKAETTGNNKGDEGPSDEDKQKQAAKNFDDMIKEMDASFKEFDATKDFSHDQDKQRFDDFIAQEKEKSKTLNEGWKAQEEQDKKDKASAAQLAQLQKQQATMRNEALHGMVANFRTAAGQMKEFGTAYKVTAQAMNMIDTYQSATASYKALAGIPIVGPALGFVAAAAAIAAGIANAKSIADQKFAGGGVSTGGMALVGEQGPELLNLPAGTTVYNNQQSKAISNRGGDKTMHVYVNQRMDKSEIHDMLLEMNREGFLQDLKAEWSF